MSRTAGLRSVVTIPVMIVSLFALSQSPAEALDWNNDVLERPAQWYGSKEARIAADRVLVYQSEYGAWPKNTDLLDPIKPEALKKLNRGGRANTIDNGATTLPMRFLARVHQASPAVKYKTAFKRGVNYLLDSQYPNGGFPQFYPLRGNQYYSRITYNDDAMGSAMSLLKDVADGRPPYDLVGAELRAKAAASVKRGTNCSICNCERMCLIDEEGQEDRDHCPLEETLQIFVPKWEYSLSVSEIVDPDCDWVAHDEETLGETGQEPFSKGALKKEK